MQVLDCIGKHAIGICDTVVELTFRPYVHVRKLSDEQIDLLAVHENMHVSFQWRNVRTWPAS